MRAFTPVREKKGLRYRYYCINNTLTANRCEGRGNAITALIADNHAWSKAIEIIRDPSQVDRKLAARRKADPNTDRRQWIAGELAKVKAKQKRLRDRLEDEDIEL